MLETCVKRGVQRRHHACIACGRPGEFILRLQIDSHLVHLICRRYDPAASMPSRFASVTHPEDALPHEKSAALQSAADKFVTHT